MQPHIPFYVFVLFGVLVYLGIRRCYPRLARPERAAAFPIILLLLGGSSLGRLFPLASLQDVAVAVAACGAGALLGWLHASRWRLQFDTTRSALRVLLPGDPGLLVILLTTFAAECVMHYGVESGQPWAAYDGFRLASFAVWGVVAGMSLGRVLNVLVRTARHLSERVDAIEQP